MSLPNEQVMPLGDNPGTSAALPAPAFPEMTADGADDASSAEQPAEHILRVRLSEELDAALESPDPVAGLDKAIQTVADELSRHSAAWPSAEGATAPDGGVGSAIETLVRVALEMDDPVAALEEGTESLAEALAARDAAVEAWRQTAEEQRVDQQAAYRHARLHRVSELIDVGYTLDQAVAVTNANEADIRARAAAMGNDPMEAIYRYAVLNGYQGYRSVEPGAMPRYQPAAIGRGADRDGSFRDLTSLAQLNDEAFAEATKGDRWRVLMQQ